MDATRETNPDGRGEGAVCAGAAPADDLFEPTAKDMRLLRRAFLNRWGVSDTRKEKALRVAEAVLDDPNIPPLKKLAAVKAMISADMVNVRREANEVEEQGQQLRQESDTLRAALASPDAVRLLAELTELAGKTAPPGHQQIDSAALPPPDNPGKTSQ